MKKNILLLLFAGASLAGGAQQYTVSGKAPEGVRKVYLRNVTTRAVDSTAVADGSFSFKGDAAGEIFASVSDGADHELPVVLDGNVKVDLSTETASGTSENEELTKWNTVMETHSGKLSELMTEYRSYREKGEVPAEVEKRISEAYEAEMGKMTEAVKRCCNENMTAKFPAYFLAQMASMMEKEDVVAIVEAKPAFLETSILSRVKSSVEGWKRQMPGQMFTDLTMADTLGVEHKLSEYVGRGKYVLVDFWASWCGPCRAEMPQVKALYEKYHDKGFDIVGLSFDNSKKAWTAGIQKLGLPWHHLSDLKGWQCVAASVYGINSIPATLLVGPDGKIVAGGLRGEALEKKLAEIFE